ncbi:MAG: magnesium chelatase subunit D [Pseudomonadota bacterium]
MTANLPFTGVQGQPLHAPAPIPGDDVRAMVWADSCMAAACFAVAPAGFGGISVRAHAGPVRDRMVAHVSGLVKGYGPLRKLPVHCPDDRLAGGLDLAATLSQGRPVAQRGLLSEADGGVVVVPMAERAEGLVVTRLLNALDSGKVAVERDGLAHRLDARVGVVALDEGLDDHETLAPALADRLAFSFDLRALSIRDCVSPTIHAADVEAARGRYEQRSEQGEIVEAVMAIADAFGVRSARIGLFAVRAAHALAALNGRDLASQDDVGLAARLVIAPRATQLPSVEQTEPVEDEPSEQDRPDPRDQEQADPKDRSDLQADDNSMDQGPLDDRVVEAVTAAIPADLLQQLKLGAAFQSQSSRSAAGQGAVRMAPQRGRPLGSKRGRIGGHQRLHVVDTLRTAAPWQTLRKRERGNAGVASSVDVRADDIRVRRFKHREESVTIFVVDASGSSALNRLAEVKGAVELLLAESYARRDYVGLIAFRGSAAELILPPTRSLVRAKRALAALPGGGGTPLALAIDAGGQLASDCRKRGQSPRVVFMTDGQANVGYGNASGRAAAHADALSAARRFATERLSAMLIDTSPRKSSKAAELSQAMAAHYLPLPHASAEGITAAVAAAASSVGRG